MCKNFNVKEEKVLLTFDNTIKGSNLDDNIDLLLSSDDLLIKGYRGNDQLYAGSGNDLVLGGQGDDTLFGNGGDDTLKGGRGDDFIISGRTGDYFLKGNRGDDFLIAGSSGNETLRGGIGNDTLTSFSGGIDKLQGNCGNDVITVSNAEGDEVYVRGGPGKDLLNVYSYSKGFIKFVDFNKHKDSVAILGADPSLVSVSADGLTIQYDSRNLVTLNTKISLEDIFIDTDVIS